MNDIMLEKKIKRMLRLPFWFGILFAGLGLIGHFIRPEYDTVYIGVFILYVVCSVVFYIASVARLRRQMVEFGIGYGVLQKEILNRFEIPYVLLDQDAKVLWVNDRFQELTGKEKTYHKGICTIFPEITREWLGKTDGDIVTQGITMGERHFTATIQRLKFGTILAESGVAEKQNEDLFYSVSLQEDTELLAFRRKVEDQRLVVGLVYIDNYEEALNSVEDMKKSMLTALIDRKVNEYFFRADGLVRKLEKDRYFVAFQQKFLKTFRDDHYSLIDDIKTIKIGNEMEVTLSVGLGFGSDSFNKIFDYANAAIDLALGRGGCQVVEKAGEEINFYGGLSHGTEKNTRVKARVKALALREILLANDTVIIMGHRIPDPDALGAAMGIYAAAKALDKQAHIVLGDVTSTLRPLKDTFSPDKGYPDDLFINGNRARDMVNNRTLIMVVDINRPVQVEYPELLAMGRNVVVFDHHRQSKDAIENPALSYIEPYSSSTSEMVTEVIQYFPENIHMTTEEVDSLYAGIVVDTDNFRTKTGVRTFEAAAYLRRCGADSARVRKLLRDDLESYKTRAEVVRRAFIYRKCFAISDCQATDIESPTVVGAQAANELLKIMGIKASFVLTRFQGVIYVSARSIDEINVQLVMEKIGGGGHLSVAGAQLRDTSMDEAVKMIEGVLDTMIEEGEITP